MNHLEQLVTEWLVYRGHYVKTSMLVGQRTAGGFEGELNVVGFNPVTSHFVHVECSLDADSEAERQARFTKKFKCGDKFARSVNGGENLGQRGGAKADHLWLS